MLKHVLNDSQCSSRDYTGEVHWGVTLGRDVHADTSKTRDVALTALCTLR